MINRLITHTTGIVLLLFAIAVVLSMTLHYTTLADTCLSIPLDQPFLQYSRFIAFEIETNGMVGRCWYTSREGFEHFRASNYIWSLDGSATVASWPVIVSPVSPLELTHKIYLPMVRR